MHNISAHANVGGSKVMRLNQKLHYLSHAWCIIFSSQFVHIFQTLLCFDLQRKYEVLLMEERQRVYREVQTWTDLAKGILTEEKSY